MEATRHFYEDIVGCPLVATWCEEAELFGRERTYMHCFFDIGDGECLAFFQFADASDDAEFNPELPLSAFRHLAIRVDRSTQNGILKRLTDAGYKEPDMYVLDHGYCHSLYVYDPSSLLMEFTVDHEDVEKINADKRTDAHSELKRWLAGDHSPNSEAYHR